jgi:xanthine dehydrogenase accessory factor
MSAARQVATRVAELSEQRRAFVQATVVRAQCPTSARPGDAAVVLPDGSIEGFVGGQCAEESVRATALSALDGGEAVLLRVLPNDAEHFPDSPGAITVINPCLSGGALEIYLEPKLPAPVVSIIGATPIAAALGELAPRLGFAIDGPAAELDPSSSVPTALIVASHGRGEPEAIRLALDRGVGFIGLVASHKRGAAVTEAMGLTDDELARVHSPVGVDIGARTAEEIALSILADLVKAVRVHGLSAPADDGAVDRPATAIDPVCGMTVTVMDDTPHLAHDGVDYWFCNPGCRTRYAEEIG